MADTDELFDVLDIRDGQAHCPVDGCDWWVPEGMEYLFLDHYEVHDEE